MAEWNPAYLADDIEENQMKQCTCGYQTDTQTDFDQHVLASMHDDQDHFQVR